MKGRIENVQWMSPETKTRALDKLAHFTVKIGYPSKWRDYSGLRVKSGDLVGTYAFGADDMAAAIHALRDGCQP